MIEVQILKRNRLVQVVNLTGFLQLVNNLPQPANFIKFQISSFGRCF